MGFCSSNTIFISSAIKITKYHSPLLNRPLMAAQKSASPTVSVGASKGSRVFPVGEPGGIEIKGNNSPPIKLLTRVEQLRLLTKAEKAGLLSAAENFGLSLSTVERLGLLSKAEELGVLSAASDPSTPPALLSLGLGLLLVGPLFVYIVPDQYSWQVALQALVALVCLLGGSAAFAASNFVSTLQKSS